MSDTVTTSSTDAVTATVDAAIFHSFTTLAIALHAGRLRVDELVQGRVLHIDGCEGTASPASSCSCGRIFAFDTDDELVRLLPDGTVTRTPVAQGNTRQH